jgi:hypothetical protein
MSGRYAIDAVVGKGAAFAKLREKSTIRWSTAV